MALEDLLLPLLTPAGYSDYEGAFATTDTGDGGLAVDALVGASKPETNTVVTPQPCTLTFLPVAAGPMLPDGTPATEDTIVLNVYPSAISAYTTELFARPAPAWWALTGIDAASFEAQLDLWIQTAPQPLIDLAWTDSTPPATPDAAKANLRTRVLAGTVDFPLESGFAIGELAAPARRLVVRLYDTQREPLHPALVLPDFDDANPALVGHPLLAALESIDIDVQIFVEFRYFAVDNQGPTKGAIAPLAGVTVAVHDDVLGDVLDSGTTDADGRASFFISNWDWVGTADLFFKVSIPYPEAILRQHERNARWHGEWATLQRPLSGIRVIPALDGTPGYLPDYTGWSLGSASAPLVFYLGTPVMLDVTYLTDTGAYRPVPRGTVVELGRRSDVLMESFTPLETFYADADGAIRGTSFELPYGEELEVRLPLALAEDEDADFVDGIELPKVVTIVNPPPWLSKDRSPTNLYWAAFDPPALGDPAAPLALRVGHTPDDEVAATLYLLKCVRDTHLWLHEMTGGEWKGIEGCFVHLNATWVTDVVEYVASMTSMNPPHLGVILHERDKWDRATCVHEFAHGLMWGTADIGLTDFACAIVTSEYGNHYVWSELSDFAAMVEGWADLVANAVGGGGMYSVATAPTNVRNASGTSIPFAEVPGMGRRIEGCFAGAFWSYLQDELGVEPCVDVDKKELHMAGSPNPVPNTTLRPASDGFGLVLWNPIDRMQDAPVFLVPGTSDLLIEVEWSLGPTRWTAFESRHADPWNLIGSALP